MTISTVTLALLSNPWIIGFLIVLTLTLTVNFVTDMFKTFSKATGHWKSVGKSSKAEESFKYRFLVVLISGIFTSLNIQYGLPVTANYFMDTMVVSITSLLVYAAGYKKLSKLGINRVLKLLKGGK